MSQSYSLKTLSRSELPVIAPRMLDMECGKLTKVLDIEGFPGVFMFHPPFSTTDIATFQPAIASDIFRIGRTYQFISAWINTCGFKAEHTPFARTGWRKFHYFLIKSGILKWIEPDSMRICFFTLTI